MRTRAWYLHDPHCGECKNPLCHHTKGGVRVIGLPDDGPAPNTRYEFSRVYPDLGYPNAVYLATRVPIPQKEAEG